MSELEARAKANPFIREGHIDKPSIVGSHWWNKELAEATALKTRRSAIAVLAAGAGVVVLGTVAFGALVSSIADGGTREELRRSLDLQRDYAWSFGATSETVAFDAVYTTTYARDALPRLVTDLGPTSEALRRWFSPTLFQAPEALPRLPLATGETVPRLADALRPINTPTMMAAEAAGRALATLLAQATGGRVAVVLDLDGPEAVAAAAGAAELYDPVFLFDNWPHPRGVVTAHLTLAAAVYHQPTFAEAAKKRRPGAPPMFVLDRRRLAAYTDEATQFDNRWLAKLPLPTELIALEVRRALYVVPSQTPPIELRDVAQFLHFWSEGKLDVRAIALDAFERGPDGQPLFGGVPQAHASFFAHYPWKAPAPPTASVPKNQATAAWVPTAPVTDPQDINVGTTKVEVDRETGNVVGARSGSWNRASGGWGG